MIPTNDELRSLLIKTRRGDEESARRLYAHAAPTMIRCAALILRDEDRARDATQAVFLKVLAMPPKKLKSIDRPLPWLVTLVRNAARDSARAEYRAIRHERNSARHATAGTVPDSREGLRAAISRLPDDLAEVVILKHVAGLTFDDIALALETNRNTIASRYRRALESLRDAMGARGQTKEVTDAR